MTDLETLAAALAGEYVLGRQLGRGGMATVVLARDLKHQRDVAIKVLHPELSAAVGAERFLREIRIQAQLRHPHVVTLLDSGEAAGLLYYVMPYIEGESLRQRLIAHGQLDVGEATRLWREVVDAIAYAHRHGVAHRDIKPENVLLSERHALVVDFGVAKALSHAAPGETLTSIGLAVGTPAYMSPEQISGDHDVDHRADIYALGVLAYEMVAGRPPFHGSTPQSLFAAHMAEEAERLESLRPEVSTELAATIRRCMEKDRARRWQSADDLLATLDALATPAPGTPTRIWARLSRTRGARRLTVAATALGMLLLAGTAYNVTAEQRKERWARETGLPELRRLSDARITDSAFLIAARIREILPRDREVESLWRANHVRMTLRSTPAGARVSWTAFRGDTSNWRYVGSTPLDSVTLPAPAFPVSLLLKFEKAGFATTLSPPGPAAASPTGVVLDSSSRADPAMVRVPGRSVLLASVDGGGAVSLPMASFAIDRYEVTNEDFKSFVDAGGYRRRELWQHAFASGSRLLSFEQAMARFTDRTGRTGPATWEGGTVPRGGERYPVTGVSWYEAAAYARYAGKELPTIHQWRAAAGFGASAWIVPRSNIEADAVARVGSGAMSPYGSFDMAGNAREWVLNANGTRRYILGGGWNDYPYVFSEFTSEDPLDRAPTNGIRLVKALEPDPNAARFAAPAPRGQRDYSLERPVPDDVFRSFLRMYDYDRTPLNAVVESSDTSHTDWVRETITFDAAYAQERVTAYLFLPKGAAPPFQAVVFFPGANVLAEGSSSGMNPPLPFIVSGGRALLFPVYRNTFERRSKDIDFSSGPAHNMSGELLGPNTYRDEVVMIAKDLRRSVDYLHTRSDIDTARLAYVGRSWGARLAAINLAIEPRFKAGVLNSGGLLSAPRRPEVDEVNFLPRVTVPILMMNGRYDDVFPLERMVVPYFQRLGTRAEHKRQLIFPTQHFLPRQEEITATLDWLDRYLGPVKSR